MDRPQRKYPRLKHYDYSLPGYYYVTIHTQEQGNVLSTVGCGLPPTVRLTSIGKLAEQQLRQLETRFPFVRIDKYCVMPTHIHAIIRFLERPLRRALQGGASCRSAGGRLPGNRLYADRGSSRTRVDFAACRQPRDGNTARPLARRFPVEPSPVPPSGIERHVESRRRGPLGTAYLRPRRMACPGMVVRVRTDAPGERPWAFPPSRFRAG